MKNSENARKLNKILLSLFNSVLKMEESVLKESKVHNLSVTEIHTLEAIGEGKPKTMTHVATSLRISVSTLTAAINKLVLKGYVNRFRIPEDRRMVKLELTEAGRAAVREHEAFHLVMVRGALSGLSPEEAERLIQSLDNVNEFMQLRRVNPVLKSEEIRITPECIYQGGMGIGVSMGRLAAAVAICGGTGIISAVQPGYREPDFETDPLKANKRALDRNIREALAAVKKVGGKGQIGVNIMVSLRDYDEYVKTALEAGAQVIVSGAGVPTALPGLCKGKNIRLIPVVSSVRATSVIIRNWAKKHNRTPDAVIFEGPDAGGHLGFKEEQLGPAKEKFYKTIMEIKAELENFPECKLIVAGGIYSKQDARKAMACGADAVQLGSRFVTTEECEAPDSVKQAYLACTESDIGLVKSPLGMPSRMLKNDFYWRIQKDAIPIETCTNCLISCNPFEARFCMKEALLSAARGDAQNGLVFCGSKTYKARRIETVAEIFTEFTDA